MITIVGYGIGNVSAFLNIYKRLNVAARIGTAPDEIATAERLILPGVGAFDWAMRKLNDSGLRGPLDEAVLGRRAPVLGVCVGMQMMARSSEEGVLAGLGWIPGAVRKLAFPGINKPVPLPHMGWNDVTIESPHPVFQDFAPTPRFYFLHSYHFVPDADASVISTCDNSGRFACGVTAGSAVGVQFHPEKSHDFGIALLKNFAQA